MNNNNYKLALAAIGRQLVSPVEKNHDPIGSLRDLDEMARFGQRRVCHARVFPFYSGSLPSNQDNSRLLFDELFNTDSPVATAVNPVKKVDDNVLPLSVLPEQQNTLEANPSCPCGGACVRPHHCGFMPEVYGIEPSGDDWWEVVVKPEVSQPLPRREVRKRNRDC